MPTKLGCMHNERRQAIGPQSCTYYLFEPWCIVEDIDVPGFLGLTVKIGCECTNSARWERAFGTEEEILSGKIKPIWKGRYGAPI